MLTTAKIGGEMYYSSANVAKYRVNCIDFSQNKGITVLLIYSSENVAK